MNPDLLPRPVVYAALRLHLPYFAVACVIAVGGVTSLFLAKLRSRDRLLLWVGLFSLLYAARLFLQNELVRDAFQATGTGYLPWALAITYLINIPFTLFAFELLGRGWKSSIFLWVWLCSAFAALAIPAALLIHEMAWMTWANAALVVGGTLLLLLHALRERRIGRSRAASLVGPLLFFGACVLLENEGFRVRGLSIEPLGFLVLLIGLGSLAVRRALDTERRLLAVEQELSTARHIQFAILPTSVPAFEGVRLATRYQPMTAVAGDFYDFQVSEQLLTILVADVSGHGVPAALVSCMLKVCFAAQKNQAADPAALLSGLGRMLRGSLGGQYVTAACAAIDKQAGTITYAGAGHPPSVLVRGQDGQVVLLEQNGLFLGPFPQATYENMSLPFSSGDRLFLYTDGITEAHGTDGEEFGQERLQQFLIQTKSAELNTALDGLFTQVTVGPPQDDLTAVLLHFE